MDRFVPSVEIDEEIRNLAQRQAEMWKREIEKPWAMKPRLFTKDPFRKGFMGELAVKRYLGLPLTIKKYLDLGYDILFRGKRIDVKNSMLHEPLRQPLKGGFRVFVSTEEKLKMVDILLFTKMEQDERLVYLLGWILRKDLDKAPIVQMGNMPSPAYCIYFAYMRKVEELTVEGKAENRQFGPSQAFRVKEVRS